MLSTTLKSIIKIVLVAIVYVVVMSTVNTYAASFSSSQVYSSTNSYRSSIGKSSLSRNSQLEQAARNKANDIFKKQYWSHYGPDGSTPWTFISNTGYKYISAGENLADGFYSSSQVVTAWSNSPSHDANLRGDYNETGVAVVDGVLEGRSTTIVVAMYAKSATAKTVAPVTKTTTTTKSAPAPKPVTPTPSTVTTKTTTPKPVATVTKKASPKAKEVTKKETPKSAQIQVDKSKALPKVDGRIIRTTPRYNQSTNFISIYTKMTDNLDMFKEFYILARTQLTLTTV